MAPPPHPAAARRRARPGHDRPPPCAAAAVLRRGVALRRGRRPRGDCFGAVSGPDALRAVGEFLEARRGRSSRSSRCPPRSMSPVAGALAAPASHMLVEKPLAATSRGGPGDHRPPCARRASTPLSGTSSASTRRCWRCAGVREPGRRGFLIATERVGPFPDRVRDVGVVKDLATHDLDLVRWLGGAPVGALRPRPQHRMGRKPRGYRPRHCTGGVRRRVQLHRRLADPDEGAAAPRPRRAGDARRRHAHGRPTLLRQRQRTPSGPAPRRCAVSPRAT